MNLHTKRTPVALTVLLSAAAAGGLAACGGSGTHSTGTTAVAAYARPQLSGVIVFRRFFDSAHHTGAIFTIAADGRGERQVSHPPPGSVDSLNGPPGFMSDRSAFIFDRTDAHGNGSLWRVNADGTDERRLPSLAGMPGDGWPSISPNGRLVAVARARGRQDKYQDLKTGLYVMGSDGSAPRLVADFGYRADVGGATWSPDGKQLVFAVHNNGPGNPPGGSALFAVSATGRSPHRITNWDTDGQISSPAYSPDGKLVLFRITPPGQDFGGNLFTAQPNGRTTRRLTRFPLMSNLG
jgi:TolB protein